MRFYKFLLHLYPRSFRAEYAGEMAAAFKARMRNASAVGVAIAALTDVVPNAAAAHWDILRADLRHTARVLRRSPGFAITAALVVALGVGANTAAFSVADFVLIRPLPFPQAERLIKLYESTPGYGYMELSPGNYKDWKAQARSFESMGAYSDIPVNLTGSGEPMRLGRGLVTWDLFDVLGVKPVIGRVFTASDTVANQSVMLSYALWQSHFGGDPAVIGRSIVLDDQPHVVIGVMPADFHFPSRDETMWTTFAFSTDQLADRADNYITGVGRLKPGATFEQARAETGLIAERLAQQFPKANQGTGAHVIRLRDELSTRSRALLLALCGAALCILLLACANLANLLLARAASRERELAVRTALGAGRERLIRQILTESFVLALIGGVAGVLVAIVAVPALTALVPFTLPIASQPKIDLRVGAFACLLVLVTGLAFSIIPAWQSAGANAISALREDSRSGGGARRRMRGALVMIEIGASVVLLISSGLLVRAIWRLQSEDVGFRTENVLTATTALSFRRYGDPEVRWRFYTSVLDRVRALPGVSSAAYISGLPIERKGGIWAVSYNEQEQQIRDASKTASLRFVTPGFFSTLGIPLLQGRDVDATDTPDKPYAAVVSKSFAERMWPHETPIGKHFFSAFHDRMVVGVVADVRVRGLEQTSEPQMYIPARQVEKGNLIGYVPQNLAIRCRCATTAIAGEIRRIVHDADPLQPVSDVRMLADIVAGETAPRVAQLRVLMILAAIALLLSGIGIHGLLSFTVARRTREIGVRVALGARSDEVLRMVLREGLVLSLLAILPGVIVAYWAARAMSSLLVGVSPSDPATFGLAVFLCAATTLIGCIRPAVRAARVDPVEALRAD
ncbi:MAG TPA: ABC transporter permease [Gemmatimonadaceae bacterium]|nr:ABC transporter permease [Gemmatimonadaceae bacterium]